ncbi:MAG: polyprenyl synthetase family protein [Proteobacteria bacterium]|nr:polyprenyl synthetase family protein [Pseudomonadota bacterium]
MDQTREMLETLERDAERVNAALGDYLDSDVQLIGEVGRHLLLSGGKRLRPVLFLWCSAMCGQEGPLGVSVIFEYLHAATLLHDDVIDNAGTRRGKPAANVLWDNPAVVLVGDFLLAKSFWLAVQSGEMRLLEVLAATTQTMAEGQVLELVYTDRLDLNEDQYRQVIVAKTAVLIQAACIIGGIIAEAGNEWEEALKIYGLEMGIAFQMVDDALDYSGTADEMGKPVGYDLKEGKVTLPLIHTLAQASPKEIQLVEKMTKMVDYGLDEFEELRRIVDKYHGVGFTLDTAREHVRRAREALDVFPETKERQYLVELADYVITRRK